MKNILILIILSITCISAQVSGNAKAKLQSLVFPGWGENTLGESKRAQMYFMREAALWLFYIGSKKTANWYASDYAAFSKLHADVEMSGKSYLFFVNLGHYDSLEEYNDTKERQRLPADKYGNGEGFEWQWDDKENRIKYDKMRIKSVRYDKYAKFAVGGLILHRLISFIDVIYIERQNQSISLDTQIKGNGDSITLDLSLHF